MSLSVLASFTSPIQPIYFVEYKTELLQQQQQQQQQTFKYANSEQFQLFAKTCSPQSEALSKGSVSNGYSIFKTNNQNHTNAFDYGRDV
jgi:hypothetical protein